MVNLWCWKSFTYIRGWKIFNEATQRRSSDTFIFPRRERAEVSTCSLFPLFITATSTRKCTWIWFIATSWVQLFFRVDRPSIKVLGARETKEKMHFHEGSKLKLITKDLPCYSLLVPRDDKLQHPIIITVIRKLTVVKDSLMRLWRFDTRIRIIIIPNPLPTQKEESNY